ncbi:hypothetical protein [Streptomyces sp. NPDC059256]
MDGLVDRPAVNGVVGAAVGSVEREDMGCELSSVGGVIRRLGKPAF